MTLALTRRRFLAVTAAACAATRVTAATPIATWRGRALGTVAEVRLVGIEKPEPIFAGIEAELARIDRLFSLYRTDSALVRLNRLGHLADPDPAFLELLTLARSVHRATEGAFDPTVQPLFAFNAEYAAAGRAPSPDEERRARAAVGFDDVVFDTGNVRFARPGMAMTLNGVAQGFATDRLAALLRAEGLRNVMVNAGEIAGLGDGPSGAGWSVRLPDRTLSLTDRAVATSRLDGTLIDPQRAVGHIFDPRGDRPLRLGSVSVLHESAAFADALSTAAVVMEDARLPHLTKMGAEIVIART